MFATPAPAVGLIKTISRTKEESLLYHPTSSATDMVPEGHSCRGLAPPSQAQMDLSASHHRRWGSEWDTLLQECRCSQKTWHEVRSRQEQMTENKTREFRVGFWLTCWFLKTDQTCCSRHTWTYLVFIKMLQCMEGNHSEIKNNICVLHHTQDLVTGLAI